MQRAAGAATGERQRPRRPEDAPPPALVVLAPGTAPGPSPGSPPRPTG
ncbi:hypothetical protein ACFQ0T_15405 [Kitasatospora gansuensis]